MSVTKRIVCLANSRKPPSGRCIAGREWDGKAGSSWVRPVSARPTEEVSEPERQYEDGSDPRVLDVIDIPLLHPKPHACQTENWLLDPDQHWRRVGRVGWMELSAMAERPLTLWINGQGTYSGLNDRINEAQADALDRSLVLIVVPQVDLIVRAPGARFGNLKRRVQGEFSYGGMSYRLWVTDPIVEREFLAKADGTYPVGASALCVSLGEPHEGFRYKLVAALLRQDGVDGGQSK